MKNGGPDLNDFKFRESMFALNVKKSVTLLFIFLSKPCISKEKIGQYNLV